MINFSITYVNKKRNRSVTTDKLADGAVTPDKLGLPMILVGGSIAAFGSGVTDVKLPTTVLDTSDEAMSYSVSTGRFTISTPGIYIITANILFATGGMTSGKFQWTRLVKNGTSIASSGARLGNSAATLSFEWSGTVVISMDEGDYLLAQIDHNDSIPRGVDSGSSIAVYKYSN